MHNVRIVIGVDEAGRGPIAGPVTVAAVAFLVPFDTGPFRMIRDSKQLSPKRREYYTAELKRLEREGFVMSAAHSTPAETIDAVGIAGAIKQSLAEVLSLLALPPEQCFVRLDGSLTAPQAFLHQETIIRGDETELPITLAGILAKTTRDTVMRKLGGRFPRYGFETHKGYGTAEHYRAIERYGLCLEHRKTFIH